MDSATDILTMPTDAASDASCVLTSTCAPALPVVFLATLMLTAPTTSPTNGGLTTYICRGLPRAAAQSTLCANVIERGAADDAAIAADGAVADVGAVDAGSLAAGHAGNQSGVPLNYLRPFFHFFRLTHFSS
ncbi:hypothetical protein Xclt_21230 [Xanthomonas axonopodis pv. clitoriae]|uniref:Uncharacterized protein n=1 Tax=Xanthomonas axonopodis pv. clitoriae TaxID=487828 RepID=A0AB73P2G8_9XANT|nr:hypothetical protein Xclt_21230 [Xanthomonas axonopodis pv. clitoriae]